MRRIPAREGLSIDSLESEQIAVLLHNHVLAVVLGHEEEIAAVGGPHEAGADGVVRDLSLDDGGQTLGIAVEAKAEQRASL